MPRPEGPSESRGCDTAEGFQEWGADWDAWLAEKAARREQWLNEGPGHGSALGGGGLSGNDGRQLGGAIHMIEGDVQALGRAEVNNLACHVGRQGLTALVVADVSLSATDAIGHRLLCDAETFSDGLEVVHAANSSAARMHCQYRRYFAAVTVALIIRHD